MPNIYRGVGGESTVEIPLFVIANRIAMPIKRNRSCGQKIINVKAFCVVAFDCQFETKR